MAKGELVDFAYFPGNRNLEQAQGFGQVGAVLPDVLGEFLDTRLVVDLTSLVGVVSYYVEMNELHGLLLSVVSSQ